MSEFLRWLLAQIRDEAKRGETPTAVRLWHSLPFFTKYLGDGVLVLWRTRDNRDNLESNLLNLVSSSFAICRRYEKFLRQINKTVGYAPTALRCGVARGTVCSVGSINSDRDYVGPCINMAARLQKLPGVKFAFNLRGFVESKKWPRVFSEGIVLKKISIRGIGYDELVGVRQEEFDTMTADQKAGYIDP